VDGSECNNVTKITGLDKVTCNTAPAAGDYDIDNRNVCWKDGLAAFVPYSGCSNLRRDVCGVCVCLCGLYVCSAQLRL